MGQPFFVYFQSFQPKNTIFTTNQCEKSPSSIWWWDLNPQTLEHESSPITITPGHLHNFLCSLVYPIFPYYLGFKIYRLLVFDQTHLGQVQIQYRLSANQTLPMEPNFISR